MRKRRKPAPKNRDHRFGRGSGELREQGAIVKHGKGLTRVALVYPNTYRAGMSSLGFQTVYRLANQEDGVACERLFLPDHRDRRPPVSVESGLRMDQFDMILFSISFENDFIHLVRLLAETGIPLRSSDRNHIHPLVVAGGVACFLNPEPIAPFIDLLLLGEAECLLPGFFRRWHHHADRQTLLAGVEKDLPGAYVPSRHVPILYTPGPARSLQSGSGSAPRIAVQYLDALDNTRTRTCILTTGTAFKDVFLVETLKGCPHGCRFCTAGFIYRPPRIYPVESLLKTMDEAVGKTDRIGLVSSAILDHPDIGAICRYGRNKGFTLSFSSLRADKLDGPVIDMLARTGVKTATIAPEAGSDRMRRIINKKLTRDQILGATQNLVDQGIPNLRLYFMIGLPFETDADVAAIVDLTLDIKNRFLDASRKQGKMGTITLSINPFIPKPCTPFQWAAMTDDPTLNRRIRIIRQGLKKTANVSLNLESVKKSKINALLSLGDRSCADVLETAAQHGWTRALRENKAYLDQVVYTPKPMPVDDQPVPPLPWGILNHRISDDFLIREWNRAKQEKQSRACPMKDCTDCRICIR